MKSDYPLIPVILINYNNTLDTEECIESIYKSEGVQPFVIVVDNASKDRDAVLSLKEKFPQVHLIINEENIGFGRANNIGIKWARENLNYDFLFILNNDTLLKPNTLRIMILELKNNDNVSMVAPCIITNSKPTKIWYAGAKINWNKLTPQIINWQKKIYNINNIQKENSFYVDFASGCAMLFRKEAIDILGGFDEYFFMYDEDFDLCLTMKMKNMKILYVPSAILIHKVQGSQTVSLNEFNQLSPKHPSMFFYLKNTIKNRKYILKKHFNLIPYSLLKTYYFFYSYWLKKAVQYFFYGKIKASYYIVYEIFFNKMDIN